MTPDERTKFDQDHTTQHLTEEEEKQIIDDWYNFVDTNVRTPYPIGQEFGKCTDDRGCLKPNLCCGPMKGRRNKNLDIGERCGYGYGLTEAPMIDQDGCEWHHECEAIKLLSVGMAALTSIVLLQ